MKFFNSLVLFSAFASVSSFAHEGHDHDAPAMVQAPKGGQIKGLEETFVEVVARGHELKIYLYNKDLKPQKASDYKVSAMADLPRLKKQESLTLTAKENHFEANYDAKGLHRYTLILMVKDPKTGHDDKLNFTVEPKSSSKN